MAKRLTDTDRKTQVLRESRKRFQRCTAWEATCRPRFVEDIKFAEGDSDNLYQWPEEIRTRMEGKPMLTINKTKQHCLDVLNDARQAKVGIKIRPTGGGSTVASAQIYMGVVRHIEYVSNASTAYQHALSYAVRGGIGYWRIITDYVNDDSFDQEIFIRRIKDPLSVYLDPDINEFDGSDANFAFVFTEKPKDDFDAEFPHLSARAAEGSIFEGGETWVSQGGVKIAEYFRRTQVKDQLLAYTDPETGDLKMVRASTLAPELVKALLKLPDTKKRPIKSHKVEWFKIVGDEIAEEREWLGAYIPIVRCVGEETVIDKQLDRKGHTRALKDPQRMFNYNAVGSVAFGALQSKTPYVGPADAFEGYEGVWDTANVDDHSYLPFNHMDDEGQPIPAPQRQQPPTGAPVYMQGMNDAAEWMRMVSGQYQADMGAPSNERSGAAINARQRQGDNATFHFLDHQSIAIRLTGKMLIDLIPKIYDQERIMKIRAENGDETQIKVDPNAKQASEEVAKNREEIAAIFNPSVGTYEVESDVGPAFQTQRQEAWNAYTQILSQNKDLVHIIGDLAFKCADFPGAEEIAERLKRMVPQQALEDGPSPDLLAAQQQIQALQHLVQQVAGKLADKTADQADKQEKNVISAYDAMTKRMAALKEALAADPENLIAVVRALLLEAESVSAEGPVKPAPAPAQLPGAAPQPGMPGPEGGQMPAAAPNASPEDVIAGPAAQPGGAPGLAPAAA